MLHRYLRGTATPSLEALARLVMVPGVDVVPFGKALSSADLKTPPKQPSKFIQQELPFEAPLRLEDDARKLFVSAENKESGYVDVTLRIRIA